MGKVECFKIRLCKTDSLFDFEKWIVIKDIIPERHLFKEPTTILADPFLFVKDNTLFLFYENKKMYQNGVISMIKTVDLIHWTDPITVLKESCHLSYPWVFEENGSVYMIPETSGLKSIRLYKGNEDLTRFEFDRSILFDTDIYNGGFSFSDSSIYKKDNIYYLMTTVNNGKNNILKLYISKSLYGDYIEHPNAILRSDNSYGRNAGSLFYWEKQLYRVAQDCKYRYGDNVNLLAITDLSDTSYNEVTIKDKILPSQIPFYKEGGHQFNVVKFKKHIIIATDAKEYHNFFFRRILHKLKIDNLRYFK